MACLRAALGCGSENDDHVRGSAASGGTSAGTSGDAAAGTNAGGTATGSGGATGGSGGGSGSGAVSCTGAFGPSREVMAAPTIRWYTSPTLSPDELEILYVQFDVRDIAIHRSVRGSIAAPFPLGQRFTELDAAVERCQPKWIASIDLSGDGLTAYIGCNGDYAFGRLIVARRSRIGAPFALDPQDYGMVGLDVSVSADQLTVFSQGPLTGDVRPLMLTRSSTSAAFGAGVKIPGLENVIVNTIDPSPDGLWLFGAIGRDLVVARRDRSDAPFGAFNVVLVADAGRYEWTWEPEISRDCRRLYYVSKLDPSPGMLDPVTSVRVVER